MYIDSSLIPWRWLQPAELRNARQPRACKVCGREFYSYVSVYGRRPDKCPDCRKAPKVCPPIEQSIEEPKPMKCNACVHSDITEGCKKGLKESYDCTFGEWECSLCLTLVPLALSKCPNCGFCIDC